MAAEDFFRRYAERKSLSIEKIEQENIELMMCFPVQSALDFEITVGMDSGDGLCIGAGEHWGSWWVIDGKFDEAASRVSEILNGLIDGRCRVAETRQFGRVRKTAIEQLINGTWKAMSTRWSPFVLPFCAKQVVYLRNLSGKPKSELKQTFA
jgi:hypothetical protein